ncbi:MAG: hypothetical protein NZZ41_06860, partial [Candidatus Dojkabacteria bacterium]|nr:hypothetical protein [Candidatus Dojkabacteria bacterium]
MAEFKFEDVFESDFFEKIANGFEQIKQKAKEFEVVLLNLSKAFADKAQDEFNKDILLSIDYLQKSKQVFLDLQKVIEQNKKLESEVQKLKADLNKIRAEEKKVISELKKVEEGALAQKVKEQVITRELIKDLKEEAKSKIALESANDLLNKSVSESFNSYNELTETLEKLKRVYKDLAAAGQENTEMGKKVAEAITKLDIKVNQINEDVGEFRKLVGSYANEISKSLENVGQELAGDFASNLRNTFNVASAGINELIINLTRARSAVQAVSIAFNVLGKTIK